MPLAYALTDIDYLSNNKLLAGVVENIITESETLQHLKFKPLNNKALVYNRELTLPTAAMMARGDTLVSSSLTFSSVTATLKEMYTQQEVDKFDIATRSDTNDPVAIAVSKAAKAMGRLFDRKFIYGNATSVSTEFNGLHALVATSSPDMTVTCASAATTPGGLTITKFYEFIDKIQPGRPDLIIMNRTVRRLLSLWAQGTGSSLFAMTVDAGLGKVVTHWDGIPIVINDWITNVELLASSAFSAETGGSGTGAGGVSTSCFAVKLGEDNSGVVGLNANGGMRVDTIEVMENSDAILKRTVWYTALALYGNYSLARIDGIAPATAVVI